MKSFTMFGSHVCPDTIAAMCILDKKGLSYTYKDITGTMIFLKEFLHLRDSREDFQAVKEGGYVGIPCFLFEDGSLTFSVEEAISAKVHFPSMQAIFRYLELPRRTICHIMSVMNETVFLQ